jgi:hypothetical protein
MLLPLEQGADLPEFIQDGVPLPFRQTFPKPGGNRTSSESNDKEPDFHQRRLSGR